MFGAIIVSSCSYEYFEKWFSLNKNSVRSNVPRTKKKH